MAVIVVVSDGIGGSSSFGIGGYDGGYDTCGIVVVVLVMVVLVLVIVVVIVCVGHESEALVAINWHIV